MKLVPFAVIARDLRTGRMRMYGGPRATELCRVVRIGSDVLVLVSNPRCPEEPNLIGRGDSLRAALLDAARPGMRDEKGGAR